MSTVRRRVLRPTAPTPVPVGRRQERQREKLAADRDSLRRWMTRLKRAFNTVEKLHRRIARLEKEVGSLA